MNINKWASPFELKKKGNSQYQLVDTVKLRIKDVKKNKSKKHYM
jgi:hypothetical protein